MAEIGDRHPRDAVSLVLGLILATIAGLFLLVDLTDQSVDLRWAGPVALMAIGALGLAASLRR
jgi:hypothetical protein